ncbi:MAG: hypothetical protein M1837_002277 [Sclerophora amabilis]|nr:MAG: hypothetical protein M1837_002277 [Sclerophora amabilis]
MVGLGTILADLLPHDGVLGIPGPPHQSWRPVLGALCLGWYLIVILVCALGYVQLWLHYSSVPRPPVSSNLPASKTPHVTILRPVKGQEPALYDCLASTFRQDYPVNKLTIFLCISSFTDPAYPVLQRLLEDFPALDARILVETEDRNAPTLGPNPKISNMSRGYREAKGDILWVVDCNVWVGKGVAGRMVDKLCGFRGDGAQAERYKFVHQLPLVVDVDIDQRQYNTPGGGRGILQDKQGRDIQVASTSTESYDIRSPPSPRAGPASIRSRGGGRMEELFLSSAHAKFYTAINTVLVAPCIIGKSNMFRRSHLNYLTTSNPAHKPGIDFFSDNICEDHLIGDLLWYGKVAEEHAGEKWGKHALVFGDLAIQPVAHMSIKEYFARRVRWLRVRKFTVPLATLVEPGTESFVCSLYGAYAVTSLSLFAHHLHIPQTWTVFALFWLLNVTAWAAVDWTVYLQLHSAVSLEIDQYSPPFVRPPAHRSRRPFTEWLLAWLGREAMAFPVWAWAIFGGTTVSWRGKKFWVGTDMKVHEIRDRDRDRERAQERAAASTVGGHTNGYANGNTYVNGKSRTD